MRDNFWNESIIKWRNELAFDSQTKIKMIETVTWSGKRQSKNKFDWRIAE